MEEEFKFVKQFSKEKSPEERKELATEIKIQRQEYFSQKETLAREFENLLARSKEKEVNISNVVQEIDMLERSIDDHKRSKISEILNYFEIKTSKKQLQEKIKNKEQFIIDYENLKSLIIETQEQLRNKQKLDTIKETLNKFYKGKFDEWQVYEKEQKLRQVDNISKNNKVIFVHGIHPSYVPGDNSLLRKNVDWETKLKICLSLEPTLSCSTIKKGDTHRNMWARMGVILNNGIVSNAYPFDAATIALSPKERKRIRTTGEEGKNIGEKIDTAINFRHSEAYNELVVENPKIAGFYVCLDKTEGIIKTDLVASRRIARTAKEFGMNLYAIQDGEIYNTEYNPETQKIISKEKIDYDQIASEKFQISDTQREKIINDLFIECPFNVRSPEIEYFEGKTCGAQAYTEINVPKKPDDFKGELVKYEKNWLEYGSVIGEGEEIRVVANINGIGKETQYFLKDNKFFKRITNKFDQSAWVHAGRDYGLDLGFIQIGAGNVNLERKIVNNQDYFEGMTKEIDRWIREKDEIEKTGEKYDGQSEYYKNLIKRLGFHLYGFAEQAQNFGDQKSQEEALKLASGVVSKEEYQEFFDKRIDENGRFKMTMDDLSVRSKK